MSAAKITPKSEPSKPAPKKPGKDTVYVDIDDEITSIIDKVDSTKEKIVALVLPKRTAVLQSIVNMRLLKRSAENAGKNVVLITSETALLPLAGAVGLHVAKNLQSKPVIPPHPHGGESAPENEEVSSEEVADDEELPEKLDYNRPIGELAATSDEPEVIDLENEDEDIKGAAAAAGAVKGKKAKKNKALKVPNFDKFRLLIIGGIAAFVALVVFIILALTVLPHAKVIVKASSTPISIDFDLTASGTAKELDEDKGIIPSSLKTSDQTAASTVQASGQKNNGDKATGTMVFYNCNKDDTLAGNNLTIPAGTGVSANGLTFITTQSATVPPSNFVPATNTCSKNKPSNSVGVKAQNPGTKYNIDSTTYAASGFSTVSGTGSKMAGGTDVNVTTLTQSDVDGATKKISTADSDNFIKTFQKQLEDTGFYVFTSTMKVGQPAVNSTPAVGTETSSASVTVKITYSVLVVQKSDFEKAVKDALGKKIDKKKERLSDESDVLKNLTVSVQNQTANSADARLSVTKETSTLPLIYEDTIKEQAKGKKEGQIKETLQGYPGVKDVEVKLSPFWVSSVPKNTGKIKVEIQGIKTE